MKLRHAAAGIVVILFAVMAVGPAEADSSGRCGGEQSAQRQHPPELRFGGPSVSWDEAIRGGDRQLTEAESEAAIADTERNSSMSHYYPDRPDDPIENPPQPTNTLENATPTRSCP
ncbi:hypothetical protein ACIA5D_49985 [Actinoplanes sp. NPDC051513]|uniref:hypothetical protein n=1 Tax=Actinoplanes sp. NPDC051513 TaxID=3363908 RepID=UPI003798AE7E